MGRKRKTVRFDAKLRNSSDMRKGTMVTTLWLKPYEAKKLREISYSSMFGETVLSEWASNYATRHHKRRMNAIMKAYDKITYKLEEDGGQ